MTPTLPARKHPVHMPNLYRQIEPVIVFLTVCAAKRRPVLSNSKMHELLAKAWTRSSDWLVGRHMIMPDHIHLFCSTAGFDAKNVKNWAAYWKGLVSRGLRGYGPLATATDGVETVRSGQGRGILGGPGSTPANTDGAVWQRDVWDTQLRSGEHCHEKWEHVRMNPVRQNLTKEPDLWPFQGEMNKLLW